MTFIPRRALNIVKRRPFTRVGAQDSARHSRLKSRLLLIESWKRRSGFEFWNRTCALVAPALFRTPFSMPSSRDPSSSLLSCTCGATRATGVIACPARIPNHCSAPPLSGFGVRVRTIYILKALVVLPALLAALVWAESFARRDIVWILCPNGGTVVSSSAGKLQVLAYKKARRGGGGGTPLPY